MSSGIDVQTETYLSYQWLSANGNCFLNQESISKKHATSFITGPVPSTSSLNWQAWPKWQLNTISPSISSLSSSDCANAKIGIRSSNFWKKQQSNMCDQSSLSPSLSRAWSQGSVFQSTPTFLTRVLELLLRGQHNDVRFNLRVEHLLLGEFSSKLDRLLRGSKSSSFDLHKSEENEDFINEEVVLCDAHGSDERHLLHLLQPTQNTQIQKHLRDDPRRLIRIPYLTFQIILFPLLFLFSSLENTFWYPPKSSVSIDETL